MSLTAIGPVSVQVRKPTFNWTSVPGVHGFVGKAHGHRPASISGVMQWPQALALSDLIANPTDRVTIGDQTGLLEYLNFDDVLLIGFTGYYLLQQFDLLGEWQWAGHGLNYPVGFTLKGIYIGDPP